MLDDILAEVMRGKPSQSAMAAETVAEIEATVEVVQIPPSPECEEEDSTEEEAAEEEEAIDEAEAEALAGPPEPPEPPKPKLGFEAIVATVALKAFLAQVGAVAAEVKVVATYDGWHVKAVDPAHISLVEVTLDRAAFPTWKPFWVTANEASSLPYEVAFGLDVEKLAGVLKAYKGDVVGIEYRETDHGAWLDFLMGSAKRGMSTIDTTGMTDPKIPTMKWGTSFRIPAKTLAGVVKAARQLSDHIVLDADFSERRLTASAEGDVDRYSESFDAEFLTDGGNGKYRSIFRLDYLDSFLKTVKGTDLTVSMGQDYPLGLEWDNAETKGACLLAPRIESD